jgi:hypothetical protein
MTSESQSHETEKAAPPQDRDAGPTPQSTLSQPSAASLNSPAQTPAKRGVDTVAGNSFSRSAPANAIQDEKKSKSLSDGRQIEPQAVPAPPSPAPEAARAAAPPSAAAPSEAKTAPGAAAVGALRGGANANAAENAPAQEKQAGALQAQAGAAVADSAQQNASAALREGERRQAFAVARPLQKDSSTLRGPSGLVHWRAGKGGVIERSANSGKSWNPQTSPSKDDWLAGSAFSDAVCWLAGRHGAIALTSDGQRWELVPPPAQAAGSDGAQPDWIAITASGPQSASVTATDGRKFATTDGGKTWQPQP